MIIWWEGAGSPSTSMLRGLAVVIGSVGILAVWQVSA